MSTGVRADAPFGVFGFAVFVLVFLFGRCCSSVVFLSTMLIAA
jgi:hypothetical protein